MFNDPAFMMYILEQEGELDTPLGKHNKMIKNLRERACWGLLDEDDVREEAAAAGLETPTDQEIDSILNEVNGY
jgi:hypothetical protein